MKEIIKELSGWLLYIVLIIALTWTVVTFVGQRTEVSGYLCGAENRSQWFFYGNYTVR